MPLFNVYSGQGTAFSLHARIFLEETEPVANAMLEYIPGELWHKDLIRAEPGEIVRDKSGKEWFAVKVNTIGET
jgi:hypothetical protein